MFNSVTACWIKFHRQIAKPFFQQLRTISLNNFSPVCMKSKQNKLSSCVSFNALGLPLAAASNHFELVFKVLDSNGDGKISSKELSEVLRRFGYEKLKATKEAEEMVREMDSDGDGFVNLDEFLDAVNSNGRFDSVFKEEEAEEDNDALMDAFLLFDADKNGLISAKELQRVLNKLGCQKCSLKACKQMIEGVDNDGDGFVNYQDFRLMMTAKADVLRLN